jgi:hypothetical protein
LRAVRDGGRSPGGEPHRGGAHRRLSERGQPGFRRLAVNSQDVVPIKGAPAPGRLPRRHARARPRKSQPGRRCSARRSLTRQKLLSALLLAHRRQREATRRRGSQRDRSLTVSPDPEAFPEGTLEIALVRTGREEAVATTLPCGDFASGGRGWVPFRHAWPAAWSRGECRRAGAAH